MQRREQQLSQVKDLKAHSRKTMMNIKPAKLAETEQERETYGLVKAQRRATLQPINAKNTLEKHADSAKMQSWQ